MKIDNEFTVGVPIDQAWAVLTDLVAALAAGAPGALDPLFRSAFDAAASDAARLRVVVDQVASLTDPPAMAWHAKLCG